MNQGRPDLLRTQDLLREAQLGRRDALEELLARYRPRLERWASGRLPRSARSLLDTGDLVQETLLRALESIGSIGARHPGSFESYVRQAVLNRIRDQIRWARRRSGGGLGSDSLADPGPSPLEEAIGGDVVRLYEKGMSLLADDERQILHFRIELDMSYEDIAALMNKPSPDAARMAIQRSLHKLAMAMRKAESAGRSK
ncbi:MAG TPA: RNA polymerase sigma factor [Candidatus Eisenbacteria bacterium]|nr:RNA polymerase sigma factor [Candidatus Eisenbacteria bacterium]